MGMNDSAKNHSIEVASDNRTLFDRTLERHIERLVGVPYGISGLPLNLTTISCLVLLTEQISNEIESFSAPSERYSLASFNAELAEIGLDPTIDPASTIQDMIQKGYIDIDDEGKLTVQKPTLSMAQLLDRIFPKMPGMNLVAYLIQTQDEVASGRKDPAFAINQFDETLQIQGVTLKQESRPGDGKPAPGLVNEKRPTPVKDHRASMPNTDARRFREKIRSEHDMASRNSPRPSSGSKILSSSGSGAHMAVREIRFSDLISRSNTGNVSPQKLPDESSPEEDRTETEKVEAASLEKTLPESTGPHGVQPEGIDTGSESNERQGFSEATPAAGEPDAYALVDEKHAVSSDETASASPSDDPIETGSGTLGIGSNPGNGPASEPATATVSEINGTVYAEEAIERHIAEFEDDLALQCPLCKSATIKEEQTSTGKIYYKCPDRKCNFISWGKPYHLVCPRCQNPFLIETTDRDDTLILKCPRATCNHRQNTALSGEEATSKTLSSPLDSVSTSLKPKRPRRRVVRRRVVRKKR